jgi:hypothetical protein
LGKEIERGEGWDRGAIYFDFIGISSFFSLSNSKENVKKILPIIVRT